MCSFAPRRPQLRMGSTCAAMKTHLPMNREQLIYIAAQNPVEREIISWSESRGTHRDKLHRSTRVREGDLAHLYRTKIIRESRKPHMSAGDHRMKAAQTNLPLWVHRGFPWILNYQRDVSGNTQRVQIMRKPESRFSQ